MSDTKRLMRIAPNSPMTKAQHDEVCELGMSLLTVMKADGVIIVRLTNGEVPSMSVVTDNVESAEMLDTIGKVIRDAIDQYLARQHAQFGAQEAAGGRGH